MSWSGTARSGQFIFQTGGNRIYWCGYDDKTYIERESRRITIANTEKGEHLEIVSDHKQDPTVCYARLVHVLDLQHSAGGPGVRPRARLSARPVEPFGPRGNMTFSGLVMRLTSNLLTLKSRAGAYQTIHLRPDTRYSTEGQIAEANNIPVNTVVFVRCGKNLDDEVEAFQVVWGEILQPQE